MMNSNSFYFYYLNNGLIFFSFSFIPHDKIQFKILKLFVSMILSTKLNSVFSFSSSNKLYKIFIYNVLNIMIVKRITFVFIKKSNERKHSNKK